MNINMMFIYSDTAPDLEQNGELDLFIYLFFD